MSDSLTPSAENFDVPNRACDGSPDSVAEDRAPAFDLTSIHSDLRAFSAEITRELSAIQSVLSAAPSCGQGAAPLPSISSQPQTELNVEASSPSEAITARPPLGESRGEANGCDRLSVLKERLAARLQAEGGPSQPAIDSHKIASATAEEGDQ